MQPRHFALPEGCETELPVAGSYTAAEWKVVGWHLGRRCAQQGTSHGECTRPWELLDLESVRCAQNRVKSQRLECVLTARGALGGTRSLFLLLCLRISFISWLVLLVARGSLLRRVGRCLRRLCSPHCLRMNFRLQGIIPFVDAKGLYLILSYLILS